MKKISVFFLILSTLLAFNCQHKKNPEGKSGISRDVDADSVSYYLKKMVTTMKGDPEYKVSGQLIFSYYVLPRFYEKRNYRWAWSDETNRREATETLSKSWQDGLDPDDYHLNQILDLASDLANEKGDLNPEKVARLDFLLTDGILLYSYHLIKGKLDPENYDITWNFETRSLPVNLAEILENALQERKVMQMVQGLRPGFYAYRAMLEGMVKYTGIKEKGGWESLVDLTETLKPGQSSPVVPLLWTRLKKEGYIRQEPDSVTDIYDEDLVKAIKHFQYNRGLNPDGNIGKNTVKELNVPVDSLIDKLIVNMERSRWLLDVTEKNRILIVNIAKFQAFLVRRDTNLYKTNVMVGRQQHETPMFRKRMQHVVFNPTWTVPHDIAVKEMLPKLRRDPHYLRKHNMVLLNGSGGQINDLDIDWNKYSANHFPFIIRQEPGPNNALGRVKFLFPNKYSVYLHDTPSRYLFVKEKRAFSHGCIRVQHPLKLAEIILDDPEKWNEKTIQELIKTRKETWVPVKEPLDVLLFYWTAGPNDNGELFFVDDVYHRDGKLLNALTKKDWHKMVIENRKRVAEELGN